MKNLFAIAFSTVYLTLAVGVAKTTHYCMGRENNSALFSFSVKPCDCEIETANVAACCGDITELMQVDGEQSIVAPISIPLVGPLAIIPVNFNLSSNKVETQASNRYFEIQKLPPKERRYIEYQCRLIYEA